MIVKNAAMGFLCARFRMIDRFEPKSKKVDIGLVCPRVKKVNMGLVCTRDLKYSMYTTY